MLLRLSHGRHVSPESLECFELWQSFKELYNPKRLTTFRHLDDWPAFQPKPALGSAGWVDPHHVERFWQEHFSYCYENYDTFVFPISIHPQVSGKPQVLMMHQRLIEWINGHEGVEWCTFGEMADRFRHERFPGVSVEGGAPG